MTHVPHELAEEFPEAKEKIQELNKTDQHFAKLTEDYHKLNREIHRHETNVEPVDEGFEKQLRRQRLALLDEIKTYF
ncbi:YdcH family protein [Sneathiella limimaris]|uniref:YdcH family protein n=1 Tax=Sneathiella limimaris TaxID=1964213 RepID=UPI00146E2055|nr:DUF465 domain-containing protein [Sneathiella limimaris]